jgi:hypothetical protein
MTRPRLIHDCPYCGRTKFADETLPCCESDFFDMRLEWQRQKDVRDNWGKPQETWNDDLGMFITESEIFSQ